MPCTAYMPASESPSEMCSRGGGSPGKPLMYRMPPIASATDAKPGSLRVRAGLPVAGDARDHEPGVRLVQPVGPDVPALERAGAEVLDEDVRAASASSSRSSCPFSVRRSSVQHFLFLDWTGHQSERSLVARLAPVAQLVGLARRLDLDDLGAHVAEEAAGERSREQAPELDDADAGERPRAGRLAGGGIGRDGFALMRLSPASASLAGTRETRTSRASSTCSRMISSASLRVARGQRVDDARVVARPRSASAPASTTGTSCRRAAA